VPSQDQTEAQQAKLHPAHVNPWAVQKK
jgi:hypothetical protein